ncbi:MAG: hypothetical protein MJZ25_13110 [Fibrobacter sp.]|nr:hypothetical protein [Fibrobacter sp.]
MELKKIVCRQIGRNPENRSDRSRTGGGVLIQMIEISEKQNVMNTITTVQKDCMILEIMN